MVEEQIINRVLASKDISWLTNAGITISDFNVRKDEMGFIYDFSKAYKEIPDKETFIDKFSEFPILSVTDSEASLIDRLIEESQAYRTMPALKGMASKVNDFDTTGAIKDMQDFLTDLPKYKNRLFKDFRDLVTYSKASPASKYISTSFSEIDDYLGGGIDTEDGFMLMLGGTGIGKTWTLCKMAADAYSKGKKVLMLSMELSASVISDRLISIMSRYDYDMIRQKVFPRDVNVESDRLYISDTIMCDTYTVDKIEQMISICDPDVLYIDDISYIESDKDTMYEQLRDVGLRLRKISLERKMPILCTLQLNRDGGKKGKDASLYDVAGSVAIPQISAVTLLLTKEDDGLTISIKKHRQGLGTGMSARYQVDTSTSSYYYVRVTDDMTVEDIIDAEKKEPKRRGSVKPNII